MKYLLPVVLLTVFLISAPLYAVYAVDTVPTESTRTAAPLRTPTPRVTIGQKIEVRLEKQADNIRARLLESKDKLASRAAELKIRLDKFVNKTKAILAGSINSQLSQINQVYTQQSVKNLDTMTDILGKVEKRATASGQPKTATISSTPQVSTAAATAITNAKDLITKAQTAAGLQASKDYTLTATSEATLRQDTKIVRDRLHADLTALHNLVMDARKAVAAAISQTRSSLTGGNK